MRAMHNVSGAAHRRIFSVLFPVVGGVSARVCTPLPFAVSNRADEQHSSSPAACMLRQNVDALNWPPRLKWAMVYWFRYLTTGLLKSAPRHPSEKDLMPLAAPQAPTQTWDVRVESSLVCVGSFRSPERIPVLALPAGESTLSYSSTSESVQTCRLWSLSKHLESRRG